MTKLKKIIAAFGLFFCVMNGHAAKAWPHPATFIQSDGSQITVLFHGDEDLHWYTTTDGVLLCREGTDFVIADVTDNGLLMPTSIVAHEKDLRTETEMSQIAKQDNTRFFGMAESNRRMNAKRREPINMRDTYFPHTGTPKAVVILAEFSDTTFSLPDPKKSFDQYFNGSGRQEDFGSGEAQNIASVAEYFRKMSNGQFVPQFDIYGPVNLNKPLKTYGGKQADGKDDDALTLLRDACTAMNNEIDFSQYDSNNDGRVDLVYVVYAGYPESISGNSAECIWPKSGVVTAGPYDGKTVVRYGISSELNGFPGAFGSAPYKRINGIGLLCHEFSHCMGLPDLYPTVNSARGNNQAMEYWSLMDTGEYLSNGYAPTPYTAWEREAMGWFSIETLTGSQQLELKPIDEGGKAYRILNDNDPTGHEYFLLENIQSRQWNYKQKGHGLLVTHVNYNPTSFSLESNSVNNTKGKPGMSIVPADGLLFTSYLIDNVQYNSSYFNQEAAGDPFPGIKGVNKLTEDMKLPNTTLFVQPSSGSISDPLDKRLENITEDIENGIVKLDFIEHGQPVVVNGISEQFTTISPQDSVFYRLDGQQVGTNFHNLPKGFYVMKGRKIIKK